MLSLVMVLSLVLLGGCGSQEPSGAAGQNTQISAEQEETAGDETDGAEDAGDDQDASDESEDAGTEDAGAESESSADEEETEIDFADDEPEIDEHGSYTTKEDVSLYLYTYGHLPENFITKKEAKKLGWSGGSLEEYAPGKCIGGDYFGNYEGNLPEKKGREYHECDIDTLGAKKRGAKRIIYSNDGLIYYTEDHYESFELLYGEE